MESLLRFSNFRVFIVPQKWYNEKNKHGNLSITEEHFTEASS
jgi:hypothetical protein